MRVDGLVAALVRELLIEPKGREGEALHFHFDLRMHYGYGYGTTYIASRALHLLYHLSPGYTYVTVFSAVLPSPFDKIDKVGTWKHETSHDSCWRDIQVFSQTYFEMAKQINEDLMSGGHNEVAPVKMSEYNSFPTFGKPFQWVPVEVTKDPTCDQSYRKLVKLL